MISKTNKILTLAGMGFILILIALLALSIHTRNKAIFYEKSHTEARRLFDVEQIQTALALYFHDAGRYPEQIIFGSPLKFKDTTYMNMVPKYRLPVHGDCLKDYQYKYTVADNGKSYQLEYCLGMNIGELKAGYHFAAPEKTANP
jgi:hypothetical protein